MNSLDDLLAHGIDEHTAENMRSTYLSKIGAMNGVYKIIDITYDFELKGKVVTLECSLCGKEIQRLMVNGRNKWNELIKSCACQKEAKQKSELEKLLKKQKEQRALILGRVGKVFGDYKIVAVEDLEGSPKYTMKCKVCGADKVTSAKYFDTMKKFSCHKHYVQPIKYDESYIGRKYSYLTVIGVENSHGRRKFKCQCDCGRIKLIIPINVCDGSIKSCGCMHDKLVSKHGLSNTRLYRIWNGMRQRCYNEKTQGYDNYGRRGITICKEWQGESGLYNFIDWAMKNGYSDELSIDRTNVNGNYEPSNCRWADMITQMENRRPRSEWKRRKRSGKGTGRINWTIGEVTKPARDWCSYYGISYETVAYRVKHKGMLLPEALETPKITMGRPLKEATA